MSQYYKNFTPKDFGEENAIKLIMLAGKVEAVGAYISKTDYIKAEIIAAMLGIDLRKDEE